MRSVKVAPYNLTHSNRRTQGPQSGHESLEEALQAARQWIADMGYVGNEMAILAGLELGAAMNARNLKDVKRRQSACPC